ncbi:C-type lectin domain family 2 member D-like isoform X2 [Eublepharis macularius]|uniref:C-type lectin domain family 2 member D-like isoform X2 n=1 Tax=Eublepharis macularius TaxID=481883 RepID=A0AA97KVW9_EUBMA|nr:C-type lectin domain family 2 member D-like isoform X2 [Eublepharis macularius]
MAEDGPEKSRENVDSELMVQHAETTGAGQSEHGAVIPKCITEKKYPLAVTLVVTILLIIIIALAARKPQPCSPCPPPADAACPDHWIGYHGKCYYKSEEEGDWNISATKCSSFGATLALIDSQSDLSFLVNLTRPVHHWIGLSRQTGQAWKWQDGTEFKNQCLSFYQTTTRKH